MTDEPRTPAQIRAHKQGQAAYLAGESSLDNPHQTDIAFVWWRRGYKQAEAVNTAGQPRCPHCHRLQPQPQEETP